MAGDGWAVVLQRDEGEVMVNYVALGAVIRMGIALLGIVWVVGVLLEHD